MKQTLSILALLCLAGCVTRQVNVTSNPTGALVYMDDREVGRTPFTTEFLWYGDHEFVVRKEGYETIRAKKRLNAPWWGFAPIDLFAELSPTQPVDTHRQNFVMKPNAEEPASAVVERGLALRRRLPTTNPSVAAR